ncbi:MAG: hypothetical protein ACTSWX_05275 [Promethearchaeota archaeon]
MSTPYLSTPLSPAAKSVRFNKLRLKAKSKNIKNTAKMGEKYFVFSLLDVKKKVCLL